MMGSVTLPNTRFTVGEFTRMVRSGALRTTRVELLNGRIYFMTQGARHMVAIENATEVFTRIKGPNDSVKFQGTLKLSPFSAPDPDIVWLPVPKDTPPHLWPKPILVIEISDTTYRKDSGIKLR